MKNQLLLGTIVGLILACWCATGAHARDDGFYNRLQAPSDVDKTLPNDGQVLSWDSALNLWVPSDQAGGSPGGSFNAVQYNSSGAFGGVALNATATDKYLRQVSSGAPSFVQIPETDLSFSDVATSNVTSTSHGFAPKSPADATKFLNGAATPAYAQVKDSDLAFTDITTNNATTLLHGFLPKLDGNSAHFLDGTGAWGTPGGGSGDITSVGDCTTGACFDGTQGTVLTFDNAGGDMTLTYDGTTMTSSKKVVAPNFTDSGLTATRVTFGGASGLLVDDADMTFAVDTLTVTKIVGSTSITAPIFASNNADPADSGIVRLGNNENIAWEKAATGVDWTLGVNASDVLTSSAPFSVGTSNAITAGTIELGAASDTTLARSGAGAVTVEGVQVILSGAALGTPSSGTLTNCTFPTLNQNTTGTANIAGGTLGAIPYQSGAGATTVLAATATANKILLSGSSAAPTWSTPTFPNASATSGKTIRSDGTNWIASTATLSDAPSTAGKVMVSDGTNWITSTPTFPNASATTRKIVVSDGTNWTASTETYAVPGSSGNVLTSDGTNWTSAAAAGGTAITKSVAQVAHGFSVGNLIKSSGSAGAYAKAKADSAANAEVVGIVTVVTDADNFTYATEGFITTGVPTATAGTVYYLDASTAGALTSTAPTSVGQVVKPVLVVTTSAAGAVFSHAYRGSVVVAASSSTGSFKSIQIFTASGTWTKPAGVTQCFAYVVGGGGNGGNGGSLGSGAGGGGGGGSSEKWVTSPGTTETVTVGAATGTSSFGTWASATGGTSGGSGGAAPGAGGAAGVGSLGDVNQNGTPGLPGTVNGTSANVFSGAGGGAVSKYGGGGAKAVSGATAGLTGGNYGGGGSGDSGNAGAGGGAGAGGIVVVEEYS